MQRINDSTAVTALPAPPALPGTIGFFTGGTPGAVPATRVRYWWLNVIQEELISLLTAAGITPDTTATEFTQVLAAIYKLNLFQNIAVYTLVGGTQQVSVNGAAFTAVGASDFVVPASGVCRGLVIGGGSAAQGYSTADGIYAGASGAGGGWAEFFESLAPGTSVPITVGAGGAGVAGAGASAAGGTSSFGTYASATGGGAAGGGTAPGGGFGGVGSGGVLSGSGGCGPDGNSQSLTGFWPAVSGASILGGGIRAGTETAGVGGSATTYGAGGGSPYFQSGGSATGTGGSGAPGAVIVRW